MKFSLSTYGIGFAMLLAFIIPTTANAQVYTCSTNDRQCLIETIAYLQSILASYSNYYVPTTVTTNYGFTGFQNVTSQSELNRLWNRHDDLSEELVEAYDDGYDTNDVAWLLDDAAEELFDAQDSFARRNTASAGSYLAAARALLNEVEEEIDDLDRNYSSRSSYRDNDKDDARRAILDAEDEFQEAENDIEDADDDGYDINDAYDFLREAQDLLDDADDAYNDRDYDDAVDFAEEAEDEIENALDEIEYRSSRGGDRDDARDDLDDIEDELQDAWDDVEDADDDGDYVRDAEDYLEEADDLLRDAEDAYDDRDYDEVFDLIEEIEDLINDALDEL